MSEKVTPTMLDNFKCKCKSGFRFSPAFTFCGFEFFGVSSLIYPHEEILPKTLRLQCVV